MPEREGYCARCYPVCAPDASGQPRFPVLAVINHAPPETLAAGADVLAIGAAVAARALSRIGDLIRKNHGLTSAPASVPMKRGPRGTYRRRGS